MVRVVTTDSLRTSIPSTLQAKRWVTQVITSGVLGPAESMQPPAFSPETKSPLTGSEGFE